VTFAFCNGRRLPNEEVRIAPDDAGFLFGDGLFETLRVDDGRPHDVEAHLDRLYNGLARVGIEIPEDPETLAGLISLVAEAAPRPAARLRLTITRGRGGEPTRLIAASPYEPPGAELYRDGVPVVLLRDLRIDSRGPLAGLKSLSYQMNRLALCRAEEAGAWEALLLNEQGRLVEGSRCNVALVLPGGVLTPPLEDGCLPGTIRRRLLEKGAIRERSLTPEDLAGAQEILLMNSLIGVLPVSRVDGPPQGLTPTVSWQRRSGPLSADR
jgi:branched-subunit amino acid aminotransferase/4-amino-4-deoxychorismate lyase